MKKPRKQSADSTKWRVYMMREADVAWRGRGAQRERDHRQSDAGPQPLRSRLLQDHRTTRVTLASIFDGGGGVTCVLWRPRGRCVRPTCRCVVSRLALRATLQTQ